MSHLWRFAAVLALSSVNAFALAGSPETKLTIQDGPECLEKPVLVAANPTYDEAALAALAADPMRILKPWYLNMPEHWQIGYAPCMGQAQDPGAPAVRLFRLDDFPGIYLARPLQNDDPVFGKQRESLRDWIERGLKRGLPRSSLLYLDASPDFGVLDKPIEFEGGHGRRVLLRYAFERDLLINISYEFQGLSTDGRHYLHFEIPLAFDHLAKRDDPSHLGYTLDDVYADPNLHAEYLQAVSKLIVEHEKEIRPAIAELDRIVASIKLVADADQRDSPR